MTPNCTAPDPACKVIPNVGSVFILSSISALGVVTNALNVVIFMKNSSKNRTFHFMLGLAVVDLINCALIVPYGILHCKSFGRTGKDLLSFYRAFVVLPFFNSFAASSVWTTVIMSADRLFAIVRSTPASGLGSVSEGRKMVSLVLATTLTAAFALHVPFLLQVRYNEQNDLVQTNFGASKNFKTYLWIRSILSKFLPGILVAVCNTGLLVVVLRAARHRRRVFQHQQDGKEAKGVAAMSRAGKRISFMLVTLCLIFLICHFPEPFTYHDVYTKLFGECSVHSCTYYIVSMVINNLQMLSYAAPFFIYCFLIPNFRYSLFVLCRCMKPDTRDKRDIFVSATHKGNQSSKERKY